MSWLSKVLDRIEISSLLSRHMTTFYHYEKKSFYNKSEIPTSDKFIFLVIPLLLSILLCFLGLQFNKDYVNIILTSLSIFTGLLFTLLTMILSLVQDNSKIDLTKIEANDKRRVVAKIDLTKHLFINTAFAISLAILALIFVLLTQFYPIRIIEILSQYKTYYLIKSTYLYLSNGISFFLIIEFFLTLLMIVKRFAVIFINMSE